MRDIITELRRLDEAATPGPWVRDEFNADTIRHGDHGVVSAWAVYKNLDHDHPNQDAEGIATVNLIVAIRNHLPTLLGMLEEAREALAFYGDDESWREHGQSLADGFSAPRRFMPKAHEDEGSRARTWLKRYEGEE